MIGSETEHGGDSIVEKNELFRQIDEIRLCLPRIPADDLEGSGDFYTIANCLTQMFPT